MGARLLQNVVKLWIVKWLYEFVLCAQASLASFPYAFARSFLFLSLCFLVLSYLAVDEYIKKTLTRVFVTVIGKIFSKSLKTMTSARGTSDGLSAVPSLCERCLDVIIVKPTYLGVVDTCGETALSHMHTNTSTRECQEIIGKIDIDIGFVLLASSPIVV